MERKSCCAKRATTILPEKDCRLAVKRQKRVLRFLNLVLQAQPCAAALPALRRLHADAAPVLGVAPHANKLVLEKPTVGFLKRAIQISPEQKSF